ncbi:hypothetical protein [Microvirga lotononidis]|uniref:Uncharacterized protein n=1 Tax=Microvirga lotononidis TaxID=864069 RepID=I4Z1D0_9HYPH|nr:hypothetical protein [Microvirga lotononidis]EIM30022.1 hypothetical protein MicloDRAFT_00013430 [Microvirga lotononidis]WQO31929.1 hypothetical protein U0023_31820 [Microvirga lotononidis]
MKLVSWHRGAITGFAHHDRRPVIDLTRRWNEIPKLGTGRHNAHMRTMSTKGSSPRTLDLFEVTLTIPTPASEPAPATAKPPALASLPDAQLAEQLGQVVEEVQRRLQKGRGRRLELLKAVNEAQSSLDRLISRPAKQVNHLRSRKAASPLQEGQRKAVQAALQAGVAPNQVAKHFGLSLATIREVLGKGV